MLLKPVVAWWHALKRGRAMIVSPSAERNKQPIAEALGGYAPFAGAAPARCLDVASGSGQHVAHLARLYPHVVFQPTEYSGGSAGPESDAYGDLGPIYASIRAHAHGLGNVLAPRELDAASDPWWAAPASFEAVFAANVLHIAPSAVAEGVLRGAGRALAPAGRLFVYGPFVVDGAHTSESNAAFDARLRANDADWGLRDTADLGARARDFGLSLEAVLPMPANNKVLVFLRDA